MSGEMLDIFRKGTDLCSEILYDLNDKYKKGLISHVEWAKGTEETDREKAFFVQPNVFWESLKN